MTCAVEFIVARNENTMMISNAALRYQPTSLSADEIEELIFYADLEHMNESQRVAAIAARNEVSTVQVANSNQNQRTGIVALLTGGGNRNTRPRATQGQALATGAQEGVRYLWYMTDNGILDVMRVRIGIITGSNTEIITTEDIEGRQFILRERL
jgi:hypothetical protein